MNWLEVYVNGATFFVVFCSTFFTLKLWSDEERPLLSIAILSMVAGIIGGTFVGLLWPVSIPRFLVRAIFGK